MIEIAWAILLCISEPALSAPVATATFDEVAAKHAYEGFLLVWFNPMDTERASNPAFRALHEAHGPLPRVSSWPIDPARGVLVNDLHVRPGRVLWEMEREENPVDPPPNNFDWINISLIDENFAALVPKLCVPDACYFESPRVAPIKKPLVKKPGIWLALRELNGQLIIAGILIHKTAPKEPLKHPLFLKWRAELATRFPVVTAP